MTTCDQKVVMQSKLKQLRRRIADDAQKRHHIAIAELSRHISKDVTRWANRDFVTQAKKIIVDAKLDPQSSAELTGFVLQLTMTEDDVK